MSNNATMHHAPPDPANRRRKAPAIVTLGLLSLAALFAGMHDQEALACGNNVRVTPCSQGTSIAKGNGFVVLYNNVPTLGTVGFNVFVNEFGNCVPPSGPVSISGTVTVTCPGLPPFVARVFGPIAGGLGNNALGLNYNIPGGLFPPGVRSVTCTLRINYTVTFANGNVLSNSGDTVVCLVEPSPDVPGEPRLDLNLLTPETFTTHASHPMYTSYQVVNNDADESWTGTVVITNKNSSKLPGVVVGDPAGAVSFSDPSGLVDHFPLVFLDQNQDPCEDISTSRDPLDPAIPSIAQQVTIPPLSSVQIDVLTRGFSRCASGSCQEQIALATGRFQGGDEIDACAGIGMTIDNTLPPTFECPNSGSVLRPAVAIIPDHLDFWGQPRANPGEGFGFFQDFDPFLDINGNPLPPAVNNQARVDDALSEFGRITQSFFPPDGPVFPGVQPGDPIVIRGQGRFGSDQPQVEIQLVELNLVSAAPINFENTTPFAMGTLGVVKHDTGAQSRVEMLNHLSVQLVPEFGTSNQVVELQFADWQIIDPILGQFEFIVALDTLAIDPILLQTARGLVINHDTRGVAVPVPPLCIADLTTTLDPNDPGFGVPDGVLDANDFFFYLMLFANNDPAADLTGSLDPNNPAYGVPDGVHDANDFFFYLQLFAAGCP